MATTIIANDRGVAVYVYVFVIGRPSMKLETKTKTEKQDFIFNVCLIQRYFQFFFSERSTS